MKINLYEYCRTVEWYQLEINDEYLAKLESDIKGLAVNPAVIPHITQEMVKTVFNGSWDDEDDFEFDMYTYQKADTYKQKLYYLLEDWIREDLWDSFVETTGCEGQDYDIEIED